MVERCGVRGGADNTGRTPIAGRSLLGRLRIRAKLYTAFSVILGLSFASAITTAIWIRNSDVAVLRSLSLAEFAKRQSTVVELELMTMSDAMRGYLLDTSNQAELKRKLAADDEFTKTVEALQVALTGMPRMLSLVDELETYDDEVLNKAEDQLVEIANKDTDTAKHRFETDYLPKREREIRIVLALRDEVAQVEESAKAEAAETHEKQLIVGLGGAALISVLSGLLVCLFARAIGDQIRVMTTAMGKLADGDTLIEIPAQGNKDEIGDMARAVEVFRANAIARREGEIVLRTTNLQFGAALNSMLQGMVVWSPDQRVQLVNGRFFAICHMPPETFGPGVTVHDVIHAFTHHGVLSDQDPGEVRSKIIALLAARRSARVELAMRPGLLMQIASEPMADGGTVVTFEDVTEKRQNEEKIVFMAHHDALTRLPNRVLFQEQMEAAASRPGDGQHFAVLCLDLDHFKDVNDTLGHPAGDELLRMVAARLRHCVRDRDMVARLGGDEFAIVLASAVGGRAPAAALAKRIVESVGAPFDLQGHNIVIGTSIGIALFESGVPSTEFLKRADVALYRAKEERGTFAFYERGMDEHLLTRHEMEADLRLAVQRDEFELHYQPLYNFAQDRVTGFEALVRWNSPTRGQVLPGDFIPLAEQTGLIAPIGQWVLRTACAEAARWPDHVSVAVNLSPVQFKNKRLAELVRETLEEAGLPARRLELEITEMVLLRDTAAVMTMLHNLHDLGVRVSMDDFGTGYSSLNYLLRFPFDKIKIDRSFISELGGAQSDAEGEPTTSETLSAPARNAAIIVRTIIGLGTNLGIATIAEGVETVEQFVQIRRKGCTEVQGYFLSKPRPAAEIEALRQRLDTTMPLIAGARRASQQLVA
jgi:diguanylate cyclase (GGDEF)-like protein